MDTDAHLICRIHPGPCRPLYLLVRGMKRKPITRSIFYFFNRRINDEANRQMEGGI
jgi:hypothetical protein